MNFQQIACNISFTSWLYLPCYEKIQICNIKSKHYSKYIKRRKIKCSWLEEKCKVMSLLLRMLARSDNGRMKTRFN